MNFKIQIYPLPALCDLRFSSHKTSRRLLFSLLFSTKPIRTNVAHNISCHFRPVVTISNSPKGIMHTQMTTSRFSMILRRHKPSIIFGYHYFRLISICSQLRDFISNIFIQKTILQTPSRIPLRFSLYLHFPISFVRSLPQRRKEIGMFNRFNSCDVCCFRTTDQHVWYDTYLALTIYEF